MRNILLVLFMCFSIAGYSQELNCNVVVNAQLTGNENLQVFKTLEKQLNEFINQTEWSGRKFSQQELIDCSMVINVTGQSSDTFSASIQVQSARPVYGSTYATPIYNVNDKNFSFKYLEFENLVYNPNQFESNLVSVLAFHVYMILGLDADSFELNGGDDFFKQAQNIVSYSQQENFKGWKLEDGLQSRYVLIDNVLSQTYKDFRSVMYNYHRKGLDLMSSNDKEAKGQIAEAIMQMDKLHRQRPNSYLSRVFFDAKADEIEQIFTGGPRVDISKLIEVLNKVAPMHSSKWRNITY
ncbi:uncharacterized protein DUF4835 [Oceanihabitans sediminis]|uniref:DUF4835 family protein n=1 Tax=Oceanihabitans sediminis TaxID=1812012 RepID=A0A368P5N2_9FLAO|nr:DUF4835 family protein [Oceanihabitans sediminis]MDX1774794.1 DUF4835 family protein [Oceanihabitans sediminis]RBP32705.1 uncharacterized protein DUF4835 [Oceanihabitans sediminis]RCU57753.1 DUF4835 family protein [Oceanihabitans sediminis]